MERGGLGKEGEVDLKVEIHPVSELGAASASWVGAWEKCDPGVYEQ